MMMIMEVSKSLQYEISQSLDSSYKSYIGQKTSYIPNLGGSFRPKSPIF
jgi:hypothetical protein